VRARSATRWLAVTSVVAVAALLAQPACARQGGGEWLDAWRAGRYDEAIAGLQRAVGADAGAIEPRRALVRVLLETGRAGEAERVAAGAAPAMAVELANLLGEALHAQGRWAEAEAAYRRAVDGGAADAIPARLNLALLDWQRGALDAALDGFDAFVDLYNSGRRLNADELTAVGTAARMLGVRDPQLFRDAVRALEEAIAVDRAAPGLPSSATTPRVRMAEMFLEKYNSTDAHDVLREVLEVNPSHPGALLALARAQVFDGSAGSLERVREVLRIAPDWAPAHAFHARLLLDLEDRDAARAAAERALAADPTSLEALAALGGVYYLGGDREGYGRVRERVHALNPRAADFFLAVGELAVRQRQYAGAVALAREAVALNARAWAAWGLLGLNQLRTGEVDAARQSLETAFAGDPYNVWIKNTLDLLDTFDRYATVTTPRFELFLHRDEADLLGVLLAELAEEAWDALAARYRYAPDAPVRIEVYPSSADFSVRTVGLAGLGALGVAFGRILAMDAPSARERGATNWGATVWHEIAHAFTLGATDHRLPRWLTEGLSVLEERRARPGWGGGAGLDWLMAYRSGELLPVSRLNEGFVRPRYPAQIGFSYYQASLVAELIERDHGFDAVLRMLAAYRDGLDDEAVFRDVLGIEPAAFDARFDAYVRERFGTTLAALPARSPAGAAGVRPGGGAAMLEPAPDDLLGQLAAGRRHLERGRHAEARPYFERAKALFPDHASRGGPYRALYEIHRALGDPAAAAAELEAHTLRDPTDYDANVELAALLVELGEPARAAAALERAVWIWPYDLELHRRLAALRAELGDRAGAVRHRRAVLALRPPDRADALYRLALAHFEAGDRTAARRDVLRALEIAPDFADAQELLLRLQEPRTREEAA
jgi:tetratricopeptide (TPR) repeat protein